MELSINDGVESPFCFGHAPLWKQIFPKLASLFRAFKAKINDVRRFRIHFLLGVDVAVDVGRRSYDLGFIIGAALVHAVRVSAVKDVGNDRIFRARAKPLKCRAGSQTLHQKYNFHCPEIRRTMAYLDDQNALIFGCIQHEQLFVEKNPKI